MQKTTLRKQPKPRKEQKLKIKKSNLIIKIWQTKG